MRLKVQILIVLCFGAVAAVAVESQGERWQLANDVQLYYKCLPYSWYLVDREATSFAKGDLVEFEAPEHAEHLPTQFRVIKLIAAVEGDRWSVAHGKLSINGEYWGDTHLVETLELNESDLEIKGVVPRGHLFVVGTNPSSYDSRYWGPLNENQVRGKAYAVL